MADDPYADDLIKVFANACEKQYGASIEELRERIVHYWGGADGIIKELRGEYEEADPGSRTREQILSSIMKILIAGGDVGGGDADMAPEDIRAELKDLLGDLNDPAN